MKYLKTLLILIMLLLFSAKTTVSAFSKLSTNESEQYVTVIVTFPEDYNVEKIEEKISLSKCKTAFECFSNVVAIECKWFDAVGALGCKDMNIKKTCFYTKIGTVKQDFSNAWHVFYVNGFLSKEGISCYVPKPNDVLELRYTEYKNNLVYELAFVLILAFVFFMLLSSNKLKKSTKKL